MHRLSVGLPVNNHHLYEHGTEQVGRDIKAHIVHTQRTVEN